MRETLRFDPVADDDQIATVATLAHSIWREHFTPIIGAAQVDYMLENLQSAGPIRRQIEQGLLYFLLVEQNEPIGYFAIRPEREASRLMLSKFYLLEHRRGRGLARGVMTFIEEYCRERRIATLWLTVNKYNKRPIAVYEKLGFRIVEAVVQDIGGGFVMDDYRMEKFLS